MARRSRGQRLAPALLLLGAICLLRAGEPSSLAATLAETFACERRNRASTRLARQPTSSSPALRSSSIRLLPRGMAAQLVAEVRNNARSPRPLLRPDSFACRMLADTLCPLCNTTISHLCSVCM